ncbi:MAG TPA: TIGR03032 family protein [Candidatus Obscuribacterales bacterium]
MNQMNQFVNPDLPPFSCTMSPGFPQLLTELNCTLAISTYQAGKVVFIGRNNNQQLVQLPRTFNKAMGIAVEGNKLGVATKEEVVVLACSRGLAVNYPNQPGVYDGLYMPRAKYYTGRVDIHDLHWGKAGLWAVNTSFSCLCLVDDSYSFVPKWQPPFIKALEHDDFCHLNGMAMLDGEPTWVTLLGETSTPKGWKDHITTGGVIMHVPSNEVLARDLAMPHSPRLYDGKLYALLSASGDIVCIDRQNGKYDIVARVGSFIRGLAKQGDYLFVGRSKLRETSTSFEKLKSLPIGENSQTAGITVVHLPSGKIVADLSYQNSVEEIYDIQVLPGLRRPGILNTDTEVYTLGLSIPEGTYWAKPEPEGDPSKADSAMPDVTRLDLNRPVPKA